MGEDKKVLVDPAYVALFQKIVQEWSDAEADIKNAEPIVGDVVIPSIKELRYAGRQVVNALIASADDNSERVNFYLEEAFYNCHRARHDAIDTAAWKMALNLEAVQSDIGPEALMQYFPQVFDFKQVLQEINNLTSESRKSPKNRITQYAMIQDSLFPRALELFRAMNQRKELMLAAVAHRKFEREKLAAENVRRERREKIMIGLTVLSLVVAVAMWAL